MVCMLANFLTQLSFGATVDLKGAACLSCSDETIISNHLFLDNNITLLLSLLFQLHELIKILDTIQAQFSFNHLVFASHKFILAVFIAKAVLALLANMPLGHEFEFNLTVVAVLLLAYLLIFPLVQGGREHERFALTFTCSLLSRRREYLLIFLVANGSVGIYTPPLDLCTLTEGIILILLKSTLTIISRLRVPPRCRLVRLVRIILSCLLI